jgi:hypothetical protein
MPFDDLRGINLSYKKQIPNSCCIGIDCFVKRDVQYIYAVLKAHPSLGT